jgi:hypothetical protein
MTPPRLNEDAHQALSGILLLFADRLPDGEFKAAIGESRFGRQTNPKIVWLLNTLTEASKEQYQILGSIGSITALDLLIEDMADIVHTFIWAGTFPDWSCRMSDPSLYGESYQDEEIQVWRALRSMPGRLLSDMLDDASKLNRLLRRYKKITPGYWDMSPVVNDLLTSKGILIEGEEAGVRQRWAVLHLLLLIIQHFLPEGEQQS